MKQNRRSFIAKSAGLAAGLGALGANNLFGGTAGAKPAWPGPIGLALYTVGTEFESQLAQTLKKVAPLATGGRRRHWARFPQKNFPASSKTPV